MSNANVLSKLGNLPAFAAYSSVATAMTGSVILKIGFQTEEYDFTSAYDTSTSRFLPSVAGIYRITAAYQVNGTAATYAMLYKNGSLSKAGTYTSLSGASPISTITCDVYLNGTTDYLEIYGYSSATLSTQVSASNCYFQGSLIRAT